jgi:hypothetical protein
MGMRDVVAPAFQQGAQGAAQRERHQRGQEVDAAAHAHVRLQALGVSPPAPFLARGVAVGNDPHRLSGRTAQVGMVRHEHVHVVAAAATAWAIDSMKGAVTSPGNFG